MFHSDIDNFSELKNKVTQSLIETIQNVNLSPRDHNGVWYYDDYAKYCYETNAEFNPDFIKGFANPEYWERIGRCTFKLKEGKKASEAINAFIKGFTIADCGNIIVACQYAALLKIFGEEKFNLLFGYNCAPLIINQKIYDDGLENTASYFFDVSGNTQTNIGKIGDRPVKDGEFCHIKGALFYPHKHPAGCVSGFNVLCVGKNENNEDLFVGFGQKTFIKPLTERQLFHVFVDYYNLDRNEFDIKACTNNKSSYPEKITIEKASVMIEGFFPASTVRPNFQLINKYISLPISRVVIYFCEDMGNLFSENSCVNSNSPSCKGINGINFNNTNTLTEVTSSSNTELNDIEQIINCGNYNLIITKSDIDERSLGITHNDIRIDGMFLSAESACTIIDASKINVSNIIDNLESWGETASRIAMILKNQSHTEHMNTGKKLNSNSPAKKKCSEEKLNYKNSQLIYPEYISMFRQKHEKIMNSNGYSEKRKMI